MIRGAGFVLTFDHGPLGLPPLYNHGHADALSITLSKNGMGMLIDPGTYRYNNAPEWRGYFKGTRAHNTVTVDGEDQAVQESGFIWSHPFEARLLHQGEDKEQIVLEAVHTGYRRLHAPVTHARNISIRGGSEILLGDTFSGTGIHDFELNYHLHPKALVQPEKEGWMIQNGSERVYIALLNGCDWTLVKGQKQPILGWYSPRYGVKRECPVLQCLRRGPPSEVSFSTSIRTESPSRGRFPKKPMGEIYGFSKRASEDPQCLD